jgi:hypothetical protein
LDRGNSFKNPHNFMTAAGLAASTLKLAAGKVKCESLKYRITNPGTAPNPRPHEQASGIPLLRPKSASYRGNPNLIKKGVRDLQSEVDMVLHAREVLLGGGVHLIQLLPKFYIRF